MPHCPTGLPGVLPSLIPGVATMQFKQFARTKYLDTYMQKANNEQNSKILLKKKRLN